MAVLWLGLVLGGPAPAQTKPADGPWLRIETGAHTAKTNAAAMDARARLLATGGEDKSVRLWSLPDLRPLGVLRPPIGPGDEGQVYAVAVSPDARLVAAGGWIGNGDILVFDARTRQATLRIADLPEAVQALAISPDGRRLAAGLAGRGGVRVWRLPEGMPLWRDDVYADAVQDLAFAGDGRLAAASLDGGLRLYDAGGRLMVRAQSGGRRRPAAVRFDAEWRRLAVGFADALAVEVRDAATLALLARPDVSGLRGNALSRVGWSADGRTLLAGGDPWVDGGRPVFGWAADGRGPWRIVAQGLSAGIAAILPLPGGRVALTTKAGDIALAGTNGQLDAVRRRGNGDLATPVAREAAARRLRLSEDGGRVEWVFTDAPGRWQRFDAPLGELSVGGGPEPGLVDASPKAGSLRPVGWDQKRNPRLGDRALTLDRDETARSVSVAPDRVLLGASWSLRLFDGAGRQLWEASVPGAAWRVNLSPDGRLAVAALGDGTVRWHRASDGAELLALFVTPDARHWVAWTPSGYYTASAGDEDLIGWHVNNGPDRAADFFGAARFRDDYHRPDVVTRVLSTLDEGRALAQADAARNRPVAARAADPLALRTALPPVATILSPAEGDAVPAGKAVVLAVRLRSPSGQPIARVQVLVDGRLQSGAEAGPPRPLPASDPGEALEEREIRVDLPAAIGPEAVVQVAGATEEREGELVAVRLRVAAPATEARSERLPRLNAVLIGVSAYRREELKLDFAAKDAQDVAAALRRQEGPLYREVNLRVLPDALASREAVNDALVWLSRETTDRDTAVLFLAGHGVTTDDGDFSFLPPDGDADRPEATGIPGDDIKRPLRRMAGRVLVFLDTCYAGALFGERTRGPPRMNEVVNELLAARRGLVVYSATTENTRARERHELGNGVFTAALLRGLSGEADRPPADGVIRVAELSEYLAEEVKRLTGGRQKATFASPQSGGPIDPLFATAR